MDQRPRRNRKSFNIREMIAETKVSVNQLIYPLFIVDGKNKKIEIKYRYRDIPMALKKHIKKINIYDNLLYDYVLNS